MVNFICQLDGVMVPKCVFKHYSGCFSEGVLEMRLHVNGRLFSNVVFIQSAEGFNRTKSNLSRARRNPDSRLNVLGLELPLFPPDCGICISKTF